jgi:hypothetical protein
VGKNEFVCYFSRIRKIRSFQRIPGEFLWFNGSEVDPHSVVAMRTTWGFDQILTILFGAYPCFLTETSMVFGKLMRAACVFSLLAVAFSAAVEAQQPGNGEQPPQEGGRGGRGGFGGPGGGRFGFGFGGPGGGPGGFRVDRAMLLGIDQIRTELKIEESQAAVIEAALEAYREERNSGTRPDRDAFQQMSEEERTKVFAEMQKQREELSQKTDEVLNALLEVPQKERLDQISLQMRLNMSAVQTLKSDEMKAALMISDDQTTKLDAAEAANQEEMRKMMEEMRASFQGGNAPGAPGAGGGFEGMREKMEAARTKSTESVMAVLTDGQKAQLEKMKGAKFEVDMRAMMGGRGGFGGPGGGPGGPGGRGGQGGGRGRGTRPPAE